MLCKVVKDRTEFNTEGTEQDLEKRNGYASAGRSHLTLQTIRTRRTRNTTLRGDFQKTWGNVFAGLHGRPTDRIGAASQHRLAAKVEDTLEQRLAGPLDLVAATERAEDQDVFGERRHGGVSLGAGAVEGTQDGVDLHAREELIPQWWWTYWKGDLKKCY
jgi:hypothetical protein